MLSTRAFELLADIDPELFGGSVTLGDGTHYDVAAALAEGDGKIVTDDEGLIVALSAYPALQSATVYDGTRDELLDAIDGRNAGRDDDAKIDVARNASRDTLIAALVADDEAQAASAPAEIVPPEPDNADNADNAEGN